MYGVSNELELDFARYLNEINKPVWIRQVLVPGITDHEEDLIKLKEFLSTLKNVEKIELLPYHDLGKFKWENLNLSYPLERSSFSNSRRCGKNKKNFGNSIENCTK